MKRIFGVIVCVIGVVASTAAYAAPILVTTSDGVIGTFTVDFVASTTTTTITGASPADVNNPAPVISGVITADAAPADDDALFFDLVDQLVLFDFDLASSAGLGTPVWTLLVGGSAATPISDPALMAFLVPNNTGLFTLLGEPIFTTDEQGAPISAVFTYALDSIAAPTQVEPIPEPATLGLVGMGILAAARSRKARRKNAA